MILSFFAACDSDYDDGEIYSGNLIVYNYINPGCANKALSVYIENEIQEQKKETLKLRAIDGGTRLEITHNNVSYNCMGKIAIEASINDMDIFINEKDTDLSANCFCTYNLSYEIPLSTFGKYTIKINESKTYSFDYNHNTNITVTVAAN